MSAQHVGLIAIRGLPGSGKTTVAEQIVEEDLAGAVMVSRDDLRAMFHGRRLGTRIQEEQVSVAQDAVVSAMLHAGYSVVVHDTNLDPDAVARLQRLAFAAGANFGIVDLTDTPVDVCVDRVRSRVALGGRHVDAQVIRDMHAKWVEGRGYPLPRPAPPAVSNP